jgi:electron transport complex protein RnfE
MTDYAKITLDGLWKNNPATVQILGLCPLLAVSGTVVNALGLGLATMAVLAGSNGCVSLIRHYVTDAVRLPAFVMIIAALVTVIEMLMQAYTFELYEILGIFIPLIVTNCIVLARIEAFAAKNDPLISTFDGIAQGVGLLLVLAVLGTMRELIGAGTLFGGIDLIIEGASAIKVLGADYPGFLIAILPPGAFFALGCLIAAFNWINSRATARKHAAPAKPDLPADAVPES